MNLDYDIAIVGAGPVGISLALALASLPLRSIALIEANPIVTEFPENHDTRALALTFGSVKILTKLDIWSLLADDATNIETVHISDKGHFGITRIHARQEGVQALGYVVPATKLVTTLNKNLLSLTNIKIYNPATVSSLNRKEDHWDITLNTNHESHIISSKLIIAADGTNSTIRKLMAIPIEEKNYQQSALTTTVTLARDHQNIAYERFIPNGALAFLPLKNSRCGCVWTADNTQINELMQLTDEEFVKKLQETFGFRLGRFLTIGKRHVHPLKMLYAAQQTKPGLALIGNAAHTIHPIAAQGFNLGLADATVLAEIITQAIASGKDLTDPQILNDYVTKRQPKIHWIMKFTHALTRLFSHDFLPLTVARNTSLLALDFVPFLKHRLAKSLMGIES